jgi:hypothetical protein
MIMHRLRGIPSRAKAELFSAFYGTAEAVPFHKAIYETGSSEETRAQMRAGLHRIESTG